MKKKKKLFERQIAPQAQQLMESKDDSNKVTMLPVP